MRVLVTGATGSLGLPLSLILKSQGYSVVAQGRNKSRLQKLEAHGIETHFVDLIEGDLKKLVKGCDGVIHSAALTRPWGPRKDFVSTNVLATERLMQVALDENIKRFIHISTTAVYYDGTHRSQLTELSPLPLIQNIHYAATKLESEKVALTFSSKGLPLIVFRPRAILSSHDQTLLPRLLPILKRGFFPLVDGGLAQIDLTPVESIAFAITQALNALPRHRGEIYNLTNDEHVRVVDLLQWVSKAMGLNPRMIPVPSSLARILAGTVEGFFSLASTKEPPITRYSLDLISNEQTFDISKIKRDLSYKPVIGVSEAIQRLGQVWK